MDLVPNLTHFEEYFQSAQYFKVRCNTAKDTLNHQSLGPNHETNKKTLCVACWTAMSRGV